MVEIDEGIGRPNLSPQFLARDHIAGAIQQRRQDLQRLTLQAQPYAALAQFARANIQFEIVETQYARAWFGAGHLTLAEVDQSITFLLPEDRVEEGANTFIFNGLAMEISLGTNGGRKD
jgi:hypothetical protein